MTDPHRVARVSCKHCSGDLLQETEMSMYQCEDCGAVVSPSVIQRQEQSQEGMSP